jgi:hypothetical protein
MPPRNLAVTCLASRHQRPACFMGSILPPPHLLDSFLLHLARRHSIKVTSLVRAVSAWARRPQHLCPLLRPSHLSAYLLPHIPPLAIVAITSHRYPSRRTIRILLSLPSTAITTTAISFLTPLNNNNSPYMPCRRSRKTVLRGRNAAYVFVAVYIYEHTFPPSFRSFFRSVHAPTYGLFVRIYLFISLVTMLPPNRLSVHTFRSNPFISMHRHIVQSLHLLRFIFDIYTVLSNQYFYAHCVCTNSFPVSSNFLHTMLPFPFTSLPVVGYNLLLHRPCILPILAKCT